MAATKWDIARSDSVTKHASRFTRMGDDCAEQPLEVALCTFLKLGAHRSWELFQSGQKSALIAPLYCGQKQLFEYFGRAFAQILKRDLKQARRGVVPRPSQERPHLFVCDCGQKGLDNRTLTQSWHRKHSPLGIWLHMHYRF